MLIEWRIFNSAFYVWGFCYIVADFLRGKFAEKAGFERFWNNGFLFDDAAVKYLSISDNDLSNDMIDVVLNLNGDVIEWWFFFFDSLIVRMIQCFYLFFVYCITRSLLCLV